MYQILTNFERDQSELTECLVKGELPQWLDGSLYRNGAGKFSIGTDMFKHLFDGQALVQRFQIKQGRVSYQNRHLSSEAYKTNLAANRIVVGGFGTLDYPDPCKSVFSRYFSYFFSTIQDNTFVNLMQLQDHFYAMTESQYLRKLDPKSLESPKLLDLSKIVSVHTATAHPLVDHDGTTYNLGSHFGKVTSYKIIRFPPPQSDCGEPLETATIAASVPAQWQCNPCYFHSYGMTESYFILVEQPLTFNIVKMMAMKFTRSTFKDILKFHPDQKVKIHLISKETGLEVKTVYTADSFFTFHHINAFEQDGHVVMDLAAYKNADIIEDLMLESIRRCEGGAKPAFYRFALPLNFTANEKENQNLVTLTNIQANAMCLKDGTVHCLPQIFNACNIELPRINEKYTGKKYRYAYGMDGEIQGCLKLVKIDVDTGEMWYWVDEDYCAGEPVFVASPGSHCEDDGVVLAPAIPLVEDKPSLLLVIDAKSFDEIARVEVPFKTNFSFHGIFAEKY